MAQSKMHRVWVRVGISVLIVVVVCTFLSRTIQSALQPQVEVVQPHSNSVPQQLRTTGVVTGDESQNYFWPADVRIAEVLVKEGRKLSAGDPLMRIDLGQYEIACMEYENQILQQKDALTNRLDAKTKAEMEGQLAITQKRYEAYKAQYPQDGILRAAQAGRIDTIEAEAGKTYPGQTTLMTILPADTKFRVKFSMSNDEEMLLGRTGTVTLKYSNANDAPAQTVTSIGEVIFDSTTQCYLCYADIMDAPLNLGQQVELTVVRFGPVYDNVIPRSALYTDAATGQKNIYLLDTREGLFGKETYVRSVQAAVIAENELMCAVASQDIAPESKIVVDTTAPLTNGLAVAVQP